MILVEKHNITKNSKYFKSLDDLCFKAKNLYNATLYTIRQYYFENKTYLSYNKVNKYFVQEHNMDYYALPTKVSQQVQRLVDRNFKSFFNHLKKKKSNEIVKIPKYLDKIKGRQIVEFNKQSISFNNRNVPKGYVRLSGTNILIKTKVENIQFVRIVPKGNKIIVEIGYTKQENFVKSNNNYACIDLGIDNLATLIFTNSKPIIINGKPLKSINQYYNKRLSELRSKQDLSNRNKHMTNKIYSLINKRNNKINDYLHKSTHYIVNQLVYNNISTLVIGYNKNWKQDTNMGKKNNQKFVQIPFLTFINQLKYKCRLVGIDVQTQEESYTSKCSFIDKEDIQKHDEYKGRRIYRGLFRTRNNILINADVNGSYNILRKFLKVVKNTDIYNLVNLIEVCSTPSVFTVNT